MNEERLYQVALKFIYGVGDLNGKQLLSYCGSAESIFKTKKSKLQKIPGIGVKTVESILSTEVLKQAEDVLTQCEKLGFDIHFYTDAEYPHRLKLVNDAPLVLFSKGKVDFNQQKVLAIVGTRKATEYGKSVTEEIVQNLIPHDAIVVSGLAYGIDITAHKAALKVGLPTVAVLAGGLDKIYPAVHKKWAKQLMENGAILSESSPGTIPEAHFFPARNRIIAGMSDATIVVEAAEKGGALITGEIAYSYNREVFAVPGDIDHEYSIGCNKLISKQKANIYSGISDIEYMLNWDVEESPKKTVKKVLDIDKYEGDARKLIEVLLEFKDGLQLDELCWKSQVPINKAVSILLDLEFEGLIKSLPGKKYKLV
ncbi:MAG: DNA-processing protein DprA [Cyclobacteriaceae bacterium]